MAYLRKSELSIFSRDSLLRQEEALADLDLSIDDWCEKLEVADARRSCVQQKLLEHIAGAACLQPSIEGNYMNSSQWTPPGSPEKDNIHAIVAEPAASSPINRSDTESIQIYADSDVLELFNSIERVIGNMCPPQDTEDGSGTDSRPKTRKGSAPWYPLPLEVIK